MIVFKIIISGLAMGFISALPVGPSALEIVRRGVFYGFWAAFLVALGTVSSDIFYSLLAFFGVSRFVIGSNLATELIGSVAAGIIAIFGAYIIYEAYKNRNLSLAKYEKKEINPYFAGLGLTIFNPFVLVFWSGVVSLVFGSSLVDGSKLKAGVFIASAIVGIIIWTLLLSYLSSLGKIKIHSSLRRKLNIAVGVTLVLASIAILIKIFFL